jgi:hypothetical protein
VLFLTSFVFFLTLFNLRAIASDIEHEFFEMSLRLNSVFFFADEHNDGGGPMYMLQAYVTFKVVAFDNAISKSESKILGYILLN